VGLDGVLAQGVFQVDLGPLGRQEIDVALLTGLSHCPDEEVLRRWAHAAIVKRPLDTTELGDRAGERARGYVLKSLCEIGARHVLVCGPSAPAVFSGVATSSVVLPPDAYGLPVGSSKLETWEAPTHTLVLPCGAYGYSSADVPVDLQPRYLRYLAVLRDREPARRHILVCPTSAEIASGSGLFDTSSGAHDGAAVYVLGLGSRTQSLVCSFFRCVNTSGKAHGSVYLVVSLDSPAITNEEFDSLHGMTDPHDRLQFFWDMMGQRSGPHESASSAPILLAVATA